MPIKGMTDSVQPAFPKIGKLRKGGVAPRDAQGNVVKMGADLEYFRFTSERPEVLAAFENTYGEKPALINAYLPYTDVEQNFSCWKEKWVAGGLVHRCDGETMTIWQDAHGQYQRTPKPCDGGCKEVGRLVLIIPELVEAGHVGYVVLETHGKNDLLSVQASLMAAAEARLDNPLGLKGIRWTVRRIKEKVSTPMQGKRVRRDKWLVKLEPAVEWVRLQLTAAHNATMMLPAPAQLTPHVDTETGEVLDDIEQPTEADFTEPDDAPDFPSDLAAHDDSDPDEEANKADLRAKVTALASGRVTDAQIKTALGCALEEAGIDALIDLQQRLAAKFAKGA